MTETGDPAPSAEAVWESGTGMGAWEEYLAAAQALDAVRRSASTAADELAQLVQTANVELSGVRARLAPQQSRLRDLGVPEWELQPSAADVAAAGQAMAAGPAAVLAELRQARVTADAADAAIVAGDTGLGRLTGPGGRPWLRNLLVYGPYAMVVLVVQMALYLIAESVSVPALLCGLLMPVVAFALGWVTVGLAFPHDASDGRVDRTPVVGIAVCIVAPMLLSCVGALALRFL
ncbi:MAG TPA: hypothetical protein VFX61_09520 [Micromonosporaceae bacterium]|nr:hypothetical protein [Micromonosporaceae bacterium]